MCVYISTGPVKNYSKLERFHDPNINVYANKQINTTYFHIRTTLDHAGKR